ncbi:hypothetical protein ANN_12094 [Periplaneta americana]|uniref:Uncharacterized protein n=1 Tax=Periplaneta americana TaxID=6978 RepID=A0ABQ8T6V5_PERAM|nr:hypothetical protein ANN_12094 [Periplaneta americana]
MSPGSSTDSYPAFFHIRLRENPGKNLNQRREIRTHDQRPAREQIARAPRSTVGRRAAERREGKGPTRRGVCAHLVLAERRRIWIVLERYLCTPVEISRNYDFAIKEETRANLGVFSLFSHSVSKPEQASQYRSSTECASAIVSASEGLSSSAVDRSWRDLSSSAVDRSWRDLSSSAVDRSWRDLSSSAVDRSWRDLVEYSGLSLKSINANLKQTIELLVNNVTMKRVFRLLSSDSPDVFLYFDDWLININLAHSQSYTHSYKFPDSRHPVKSRSHTIIHDGDINITANILGNHGNITTTPFPHILSYTSALHDCVLFANHNIIVERFYTTGYEEMASLLCFHGYQTLENRRKKTRITSLYRAHLGQKAWVDITARLEKPTYYGRNDHDFKIKCRKQKTDVENHNLSHTELVCTRSWLLDGCQPTLRSVDIEGKIGSVSVRVPGSSVVERWLLDFAVDAETDFWTTTVQLLHSYVIVSSLLRYESPDLAPSDYHLFGSVKEQLRGQRYETVGDIRKAVRQCLREDETDFYSKGIFKLTERREKCVQRNGDYVEK